LSRCGFSSFSSVCLSSFFGWISFFLILCAHAISWHDDDASSFTHSLIHSFIKKAFVGRRVRTHHH
jgi:hypothetical protein